MIKKKVLLVGSGHAHLEVLKILPKSDIAKHQFILISPNRETYYSGLIPRLITGEIQLKDLTIKSADYAESKGFEFIQDRVVLVDSNERKVSLASGQQIDFDVLSLNVGGQAQKIPSEAPFKTTNLRPFDEFIPRWIEVQRKCSICTDPKFIVIGGGAAAVEVATALQMRQLANRLMKPEGQNVTILAKGPRLCEGYSESISASILKSLLALNISVHLNEEVTEIGEQHVSLSQGHKLPFDEVFIATPTKPSTIVAGPIDRKLMASPGIFAAGDGTIMDIHPPLTRSGVVAVHQGRHLAKSIQDYLSGQIPKDFQVADHHLNILISGPDRARIVWGRFSVEGQIPLKIKNWIDQRYLRSFAM